MFSADAEVGLLPSVRMSLVHPAGEGWREKSLVGQVWVPNAIISIYANNIGPEQLQGFHTGYRLSGMGGDDGPYGYERYLRRKTVYLHYDGFGTPAELHP